MRLKTILLAAAALATTAAAGAAPARQLDPAVSADAFEISRRIQCGVADGVPAVYHFGGKVYSRIAGEPDRLLFLAEGMNVRQCVSVTDPVRGKGYRLVSREVLFYLDPATGQVLREWKNPFTGETVEVMHVHNDPVNSRPNFPIGADGKPFTSTIRREGRYLMMPLEAPLFYTNPLAGDYQDYVGGNYHAMEIFNFFMDAGEALDPKLTTNYAGVSWQRISYWLPWMKMRSRDGGLVFTAMGTKLKSYDELPKVIKDEIALNYPIYTTPPPGDDTRPNETTWTVFKKRIEAKRAEEKK
jgi:Protein of unknown function (DUF1838)